MTDLHGRPTAAELVAAVAAFLDTDVREGTSGAINFHARVAANVLRTVERELLDDTAAQPVAALAALGFDDERELAAAIRRGELDDRGPDLLACLKILVGHRLGVATRAMTMPDRPREKRMINDVANRVFGAIEAGDYATVEGLWADDVTVWHTGDAEDNDRQRALKVIRWFIRTTTSRRYEILDRQLFDGGFVQQHVLHADGSNGASIALRVCIMIKVNTDGLITRIDEYFDPADMAALLGSTT